MNKKRGVIVSYLCSFNYTSTWALCQTRLLIPILVTSTSQVAHASVTATLAFVAYPCVNINIGIIQTLNYGLSLSKPIVSYIQGLVRVNRGLSVLYGKIYYFRWIFYNCI